MTGATTHDCRVDFIAYHFLADLTTVPTGVPVAQAVVCLLRMYCC